MDTCDAVIETEQIEVLERALRDKAVRYFHETQSENNFHDEIAQQLKECEFALGGGPRLGIDRDRVFDYPFDVTVRAMPLAFQYFTGADEAAWGKVIQVVRACAPDGYSIAGVELALL